MMTMVTAAPEIRPSTDAPIDEWIEQFHRDGYLVLHDVLMPELVKQLKADLDGALEEEADYRTPVFELRGRMFEVSEANLSLFDLEPIVTFAERLVAPDCHVMHNNSFRTPPGGGISGWHQDDAPHMLVLEGEPPTNIRLPVLLFTANYYLTDVTEEIHGPTQLIPRSHMFGRPVPSDFEASEYYDRRVSCLGKAGSVVLFNNQVWHRGAPNTSERVRYITQVSYGRRIIGQKYYPFMNYHMPEHVYANADPRLKRLLGFSSRGAYG